MSPSRVDIEIHFRAHDGLWTGHVWLARVHGGNYEYIEAKTAKVLLKKLLRILE